MIRNLPPLCPEHASLLQTSEGFTGPHAEKLLRLGGILHAADECYRCALLRRGVEIPALESLNGEDRNEAEILLWGTGQSSDGYCFDHVRQLALITRAARKGEPTGASLARVNAEAEECPKCLSNRWIHEYLLAGSKLPRTDLFEHLRAIASLKATFPSYPPEKTPRPDCRSLEEYLLKEGRLFLIAPFDASERLFLEPIVSDFERRRKEALENQGKGRFISCPPPYSDEGSSFEVAQRACLESGGKLHYVEGVAMPVKAPKRHEGQIHRAWNCLNEKVVDLMRGGPGRAGLAYLGILLDEPLRARVEREAPRTYGDPVLLGFGASNLTTWDSEESM